MVGESIAEIVFEGGAGNDTMTGSYARDYYVFRLGDGHDTVSDDVRSYPAYAAYFTAHQTDPNYQDHIQFGAGIGAADVNVSRTGDDMVFTLNGGADSITVKNRFDGTVLTRIEKVDFEDHMVWTAADVELILVNGGAGSVWPLQ